VPAPVVVPPSSGRALPAAVGPYRVLALLGEGGMGTVYLAEQSQPRRQVALKVIRRDLAGPRLLRRFEREAEVLGRLQHPGIAQVYEAGTADGPDGPQPYIAMECVSGVPLTAHPIARGPVPDRIALVLQVCDAVHYAHQRGVIHRDLKPGNVLVDESGRARVLDFGIARLVDIDAGSTATGLGEVLGSLAYMSPEQVSGDPLDVDVRSDVYALGVLLHEVLAGRRPLVLDGQSFPSALRIILTHEPPRLGTIDRSFAGDLETIAAKALEKEKEQRYASAAALADDLRHYLADEPIAARRASAVYQLRKFARRNRALVGGAALAAAALVVGTGVSTWQAVRATAAERKATAQRADAVDARAQAEARGREALASGALAERRRLAADSARTLAERARGAAVASAQTARREATKAEAVNAFLGEMLASGDPDNARGRAVTVREVVDAATRRVAAGSLRGQPEVEGAVRASLASTYLQLGVADSARVQAERALALHRETLGPAHLTVGRDAMFLARALQLKGDYAGAGQRYEEALAIARRADPAGVLPIQSHAGLGFVRYAQARHVDAEHHSREAVRLARDRMRRLGERANGTTALAIRALGELLSFTGRYADAEPVLREALAMNRTLHADSVHPALVFAEMSLVHNLSMQDRPDRWAEGVVLAREALSHVRTLYGDEPRQLANATIRLSGLLIKMDSLDAAEPYARQAIQLRRSALGETHADVAFARTELGRLLQRRRLFAEAETLFTAAMDARRATLGARHPATATSIGDLGRLALARGDSVAALPLIVQAGDLLLAARVHVLGANSFALAAATALDLGRTALADSLARRVVALDSIPSVDRVAIARAHEVGGRIAEGRGDAAAAEREYLRADTVAARSPSQAASIDRARIARRLTALYERQERAVDAAAWRARSRPPTP
jgi:tetratricopeptide (TPR) repeat protein